MNLLVQNKLFRSHAYINGQWLGADNEATFEVKNPATGEVLAKVPRLGTEETRRAISAAAHAFEVWQGKTPKERSNLMRRWNDLILAHQNELAEILTAENGKPLAESKGEIGLTAGYIEWFAEEARRTYGDVIPSSQPDRRFVVIKQPVGVCGMITPWNFPASMIARKGAPAIAAGCTVVLKPAEQTPLTALALAELAHQAGIPAGVLNVVTGAAEDAPLIGKELTANPQVRKISFTGSTEVGKLLMQQASSTMKRVSFELGGNAPFIVFADADLNAAVEGAIISKYRNCGQTCITTNRYLIHADIYDEFAEKFSQAAAKLKIGNGLDEGVQIGPLIDQQGLAKVTRHVADARQKGAQIMLGGEPHALGGTYFQPTVLKNVTPVMQIFAEETFGPVAALIKFNTEQEAVMLANDTPYGLASYIYSRDIGRVWRVAEALEYGMVGINTSLLASPETPFGGVKESGIGREGSKYGMDEFLEVKFLAMAGL
jgi:succinate-semialdehyde dehydrogenase/glutarate-semialdehyde dehydrogenase